MYVLAYALQARYRHSHAIIVQASNTAMEELRQELAAEMDAVGEDGWHALEAVAL